ncbi:MAG: hypothetical protein ABII12_05765 [Planctomycetota bacterium]
MMFRSSQAISVTGVAACLLSAGCFFSDPFAFVQPPPSLAPGSYSGELTIASTTKLITPEKTIVTNELVLTSTFVVNVGEAGLPESARGPIAAGDQFSSIIGSYRFTFDITEVRAEENLVTIAYTVTGTFEDEDALPPLPALELLGSGIDTYSSNGDNEVLYTRDWAVSGAVEGGRTELNMGGSGTIRRS